MRVLALTTALLLLSGCASRPGLAGRRNYYYRHNTTSTPSFTATRPSPGPIRRFAAQLPMKNRYPVLLLLLLSSCVREAWQSRGLSPRADSLAAGADLPPAGSRKYKFTGPVNLVVQQGNNNVATPTAAGKTKADAAAIGPGSSARSEPAGPAWWVFALVAVAGALAWEGLRRHVPFLSFRR